MRRFVWAGMAILAVAPPASAQSGWTPTGSGCDEGWSSQGSERFCEVLTASFDAPERVVLDGGMNGAVRVVGWSEGRMEVRARVWANARDEERAEEIARDVDLRVRDGRIEADGPRTGRRESWGVSWEVRVPRATHLRLDTHNGGISVEGVRGDIEFAALNGGVRLLGVAGDVRGRTTNGGLHIELEGDRWSGSGLDVETTNGGVALYVPDGYSAELVTGTVNGGLELEFPVTVQGRLRRELRTTLGGGGPTIRALTTNGGVRVMRAGSSRRAPAKPL